MKSRILVFIGIRHCKLIINDWIFNWKFGASFIMYRGTMLAVMCEAWAITSIRRQVITMRFDCNRHMKKQWVFEDYWELFRSIARFVMQFKSKWLRNSLMRFLRVSWTCLQSGSRCEVTLLLAQQSPDLRSCGQGFCCSVGYDFRDSLSWITS